MLFYGSFAISRRHDAQPLPTVTRYTIMKRRLTTSTVVRSY